MKENEELKRNTLTRDELHRTYAGEIYFCDFCGYTSPVSMADRICNAEKFNDELEKLHKRLEKFKKNETDKK